MLKIASWHQHSKWTNQRFFFPFPFIFELVKPTSFYNLSFISKCSLVRTVLIWKTLNWLVRIAKVWNLIRCVNGHIHQIKPTVFTLQTTKWSVCHHNAIRRHRHTSSKSRNNIIAIHRYLQFVLHHILQRAISIIVLISNSTQHKILSSWNLVENSEWE